MMKKMLTDRASKVARIVLEDCGLLNDPLGLSVEDIALARGVLDIQKKRIDGAQGRIVFDMDDAIISYNENISHEGKRRFVIAHELGHFELHKKQLGDFHADSSKSLSEFYAKGNHEIEANHFAAELLMPFHLFTDLMNGRSFNISLMKEVADYFSTSITSVALRYRRLGDYPIGIIFSKSGEVVWKNFSDDFCLKHIPVGSKVSVNSIAGSFFKSKELPDEPEEIEAMDWFWNDRKVEEYEDINFYEQCIQIGSNSVLSCIWND